MTANVPLKILIADGSSVYRQLVSEVLSRIAGVQVVGSAPNGKIAISKIGLLKPDLLIVDADMPGVDGYGVLTYIRQTKLDMGTIIHGKMAEHGGEAALRALEAGAFEFIIKPEIGSSASPANIKRADKRKDKQKLDESLGAVVRAFLRRWEIRRILKQPQKKSAQYNGPNKPVDMDGVVARMSRVFVPDAAQSTIVAIGVSTGGPVALGQVIPKFPADLKVPILIVQHMPPQFTAALAQKLDRNSALRVKEALNGESLKPGTVYLAPGGRQMKVAAGIDPGSMIIRVTDDPAENGCKPSVDYLFRSVGHHFGAKATGVVMTGMGTDGYQGLKKLKAAGATIIAQDEASSVVFGMAKKPIESGIVDYVVKLERLADVIIRTLAAANNADRKNLTSSPAGGAF